ncbi:MAG: molybdate ABC transporter permease subunit [Alphaproteobacteria bacterium]|nr:MAG: molybdate ABC transporter permease subunit [Alphaproteobacteria bacterium]
MFGQFTDAIVITLKLAGVTTVFLLAFSLPLAWWLATSRSRLRPFVEATVALPLVLPPTVLGFYLLIFLSPESLLGGFWLELTGQTLTFSFSGLVVGSFLYSLPFAVQPLQTAFRSVGVAHMEAAATLGAAPLDAFRSVALPLARRGVLTAAVLSFAHTVGEFGVVLMVGGNIPGRTRVLSIEVFSAVETLDYTAAHYLSAGLLAFSFVVLSAIYLTDRGARAAR